MTNNQIRRREQVKIITASLRKSSSNEVASQPFDEGPREESFDEESQTLVEVHNEDEFAEIQVPVNQAVLEIVGDMTSEQGTFAVGKSGNRIAGRER
jgi:hypothetical protein